MKLIDHTLIRYNRDNIPIENLDLFLSIKNHEYVSLVEKWINSTSSKFCVKEISLRIWVNINSYTLPDEVFAAENLTKTSLTNDRDSWYNSLWISDHPVIRCSSLRVLELQDCNIREEVLDNLLTTCTLLEKINLQFCRFFKIIKVKNLRYLRELKIAFSGCPDIIEVDGVPSLRLFHYYSFFLRYLSDPFLFNIMNSLQSVKELVFHDQILDNAVLDMIKSKFPFLESLNLNIFCCSHYSFSIRSDSLKRLILNFPENRQLGIQVYAPKLLYFCYVGKEVPCLLFPIIAPEQIKLKLNQLYPIDTPFFLKIREALNLPSKFDIKVTDMTSKTIVPVNINVDDMKKRVEFPAINVQHLSLKLRSYEGLWEFSSEFSTFFEAFFSICHPSYMKVYKDGPFKDKKNFYKLLVKGLKEKNVEIINPNCHSNSVDFKLSWCSP